MEISEAITLLGKFIEVKRGIIRGCTHFHVKDIVNELYKRGLLTDYLYQVYSNPPSLHIMRYVLIALSSKGLLSITVNSHGPLFILCKDSPLWQNPGMISDVVREFETMTPGRYWINFTIKDGLVTFTTNIVDADVFTLVSREIYRGIQHGFDIEAFANRMNGTLDGNIVYLPKPKDPSKKASYTYKSFRLTGFRKLILACVAKGNSDLSSIVDCLKEFGVVSSSRHYTYVAFTVWFMCYHKVLSCYGSTFKVGKGFEDIAKRALEELSEKRVK
jgi:hypothetical protein